MDGTLGLVLALLLSIPVSIATNLATPRVGRWLDRISSERRAKSAAQRHEEEQLVLRLAARPEELTHYLLGQLAGVVIAATSSIIMVSLVAPFLTPGLFGTRPGDLVLNLLGVTVAFVSLNLMLGFATRIVRMTKLVRTRRDEIDPLP